MATVYNKRHGEAPAGAVYVGRPTRWGNPFVVGRAGAKGECAALYREHLWNSSELLAGLPELFDRDLICWCKPDACHADHLLAAAEWARTHRGEWLDRLTYLEGPGFAEAVETYWIEQGILADYIPPDNYNDGLYDSEDEPKMRCADCGVMAVPAPDYVDGTGIPHCGACATR